MKNMFLDFSLSIIKKNKPNYDGLKLFEIKYGLEAIYLVITKLIIMLIICFFLNIIKEFLIFLFFYNMVRAFAFGMHAKKSNICLISSIIIFIAIPYLLKLFVIPIFIKIIIGLFCISMIIIYAPADTYKRPLINKKKRYHFKIISILLSIIYVILTFIITNRFISNTIIISLLVEVILILPITYKLFDLPYNNYKHYNKNG